MELQPHQQRVVAEKAELAEKLSKLITFIGGDKFLEVEVVERARLVNQARTMLTYLDILADRTANF